MGASSDDLLPYAKLQNVEEAEKLAKRFQAALPYPHIVLDDFFDVDVLSKIEEEFPDPNQLGVAFENAREIKRATRGENEIPPFARSFIHCLNSAPFIEFLERVTGVKGLIPDPHLVGGGFHALLRGGKLAIHTDFNFHKRLKLDRRVNLLIYLNKDWPEEYGGHFEAWVQGGAKPEARYLPLFNRMVIFNTNDFTFHGNPDPVACPEGRARRSIAMYYYTNGRPDEEWSGIRQTTRFINRPGEAITESEPLWMGVMRKMPKPVRLWFARNIHDKRQRN
jgi:hypothetical protein